MQHLNTAEARNTSRTDRSPWSRPPASRSGLLKDSPPADSPMGQAIKRALTLSELLSYDLFRNTLLNRIRTLAQHGKFPLPVAKAEELVVEMERDARVFGRQPRNVYEFIRTMIVVEMGLNTGSLANIRACDPFGSAANVRGLVEEYTSGQIYPGAFMERLRRCSSAYSMATCHQTRITWDIPHLGN